MNLTYRCLCLLVLAGLAGSQPVQGQPNVKTPAGRHTLWKVEGKKATVYLLGSVHFLKATDYPLAAPLEAAFTNSQVAVFETDIGKMDSMEVQLQVLGKARLPEGETLKTVLSPKTYEEFNKHVASIGLPEGSLDQFKPSMAAITVALLEIKRLGFEPEHGIDKKFFDRARKLGKEIKWLESLDFQIGLLTGFDRTEGELLLKTSLKEMERTPDTFNEIVKYWRTGDSAGLAKLLHEAMAEHPALFKRLVTDRNRNWVPQIEDFSKQDKNTVVIVGAAHLVGPEGVVELLKKRGLKVTQL